MSKWSADEGKAIVGRVFPHVLTAGIAGMKPGTVEDEMLLALADYTDPLPAPDGVTFGVFDGEPAALLSAVRAVEPNWAKYFCGREPAFCAFVEGEVVSFCLLSDFGEHEIKGKRAKVGGTGCVGTVPSYRRRGIGLKLVSLGTAILREKGFDYSYVHDTGVPDWYAKLGYETIYRRALPALREPVRIETERLILRDLVPDDDGAVFRWVGDPAVTRFVNYPLYSRVGDVRKWLEGRNPRDPDKFYLGFVLKTTGELIGDGGIVFRPERGVWEIGYSLRADQWGNGYTVEAVRAVIGYVAARRPVEILEGTVARDNLRSRRVLEKLGLRLVGETAFERADGGERLPALVYRKEVSPGA